MRVLLILLVLVCGCYTPLDDLKGKISDKQYAIEHNRTVDSVKKYYFTDEAYSRIRYIPAIDAYTFDGSAYAAGANFWGTAAGLLSGAGYTRKCVIPKETLDKFGVEGIIHEYIHHIDDIGRDNESATVDLDEFKKAYVRMGTDSRWAGLVHYTEPRANKWYTNIFGLGRYSEYIAYVGARMAKQGSGPDYMWKVLEKY